MYHLTWLCVNLGVAYRRGSEVGGAKWFIYLSNWIYLLISIHALFDAVLVICANTRKLRQTSNNTDKESLETGKHNLSVIFVCDYLYIILSSLGFSVYNHQSPKQIIKNIFNVII